ncbi:MAG: MT-A70 family methyltransferase [bacterium]
MGSELSTKVFYGAKLVPIKQATAMLARETDVRRIADFSKLLEAAKLIDANNSERRNYWGELAIWSARRMGEVIRQGQKDGAIAGKGRPEKKSHDVTLTLDDIGVDKMQSSRAQKLADVSEKIIRDYTKQEREAGGEVGKAGLLRFVTTTKREEKDTERAAKEQAAQRRIKRAKTIQDVLGSTKFSTIVVDPPWDWDDEGDVSQFGRGKTTYGAMSHEQLLEFPLGQYGDTDSHLYLWITNRSLPKGFSLLEAWGYRYVTCLTWCKAAKTLVYRCDTCYNTFSIQQGGGNYAVQGQGQAGEVRTGEIPSDESDGGRNAGASSQNMRVVSERVCGSEKRNTILQQDVSDRTPIKTAKGKKDGKATGQLQRRKRDKSGLSVSVPSGSSDGREEQRLCSGTSPCDGAPFGKDSGQIRVCPPQKSRPIGQQAGKSGSRHSGTTHGESLEADCGNVSELSTCLQCGGKLRAYVTGGAPGMGNYFRGSTEHLLFGVRGSLSLKRKDAGTWFAAPRGKQHSAKPDELYDLVESCSPGPYLDVFSRRERNGWVCWGGELS